MYNCFSVFILLTLQGSVPAELSMTGFRDSPQEFQHPNEFHFRKKTVNI